jgi:hypothetical protein
MYSTDTATSGKPQLFSPPGRSRVHASVRVLLIACVAVATGCGRTALEPPDDRSRADAATDRPIDRPADAPLDLPAERMDAPPDLPIEHPPDSAVCVPKDEVCNGVDDNCDGRVDEDQPPIPCPNGGNRVCVGGNYSECPKRCQVCVPNSKRTCITSFCTFWGSQTCMEDGMGFSGCKESAAPPECRAVANKMMRSRELEMCCIENGFCCVDEFDLDGDHDTTEMLGRCESVTCE